MKTLTQKQTVLLFNKILLTHEENKNSFLKNGSSSSRSTLKDFKVEEEFKIANSKKTIFVYIMQSLYESRRNTYYKLYIEINGVKKTIRELKSFINDRKKFINKYTK